MFCIVSGDAGCGQQTFTQYWGPGAFYTVLNIARGFNADVLHDYRVIQWNGNKL